MRYNNTASASAFATAAVCGESWIKSQDYAAAAAAAVAVPALEKKEEKKLCMQT